jgi:transposase
MAFDDVAAIISQRFGVSIETARAWLSSQTGYFP